DQEYYFLFNLKKSEPLAPGVVWQMSEYVKQGLTQGLLTVEDVRKILHILSRATLSTAPASHPKLLSLKTAPYLSSALMEHLLVSSKEDEKERQTAHKLIEESIASNLLTAWPETESCLKGVVERYNA